MKLNVTQKQLMDLMEVCKEIGEHTSIAGSKRPEDSELEKLELQNELLMKVSKVLGPKATHKRVVHISSAVIEFPF